VKFQKLRTLAITGLMLVSLACGGAKSDATIKSEVDGRIKNSTVTSTVANGVVTLGGSAATQAERDAAVAAAKGEGVKEVKDNIQIKPR
jgi:hyperosmotically inducible periplasmic protein